MSASTLSSASGALSGGSPSADDFLLCRRTANNNNDEADASPASRKAALWAPAQQQLAAADESEEDSRAATPNDESEEEAQVAPLAATAPARNKRKNFKPRNIVYSVEEEAQARRPVDALGDGVLPAKRRSTILPRRLERGPQEARAADAMDLSVRAHHDQPQQLMAYAHLHSQLHAHLFQPELRHPADASAMREYAENTMKELLGIYGLNDMAESITKHVPIGNFSSGQYLFQIL